MNPKPYVVAIKFRNEKYEYTQRCCQTVRRAALANTLAGVSEGVHQTTKHFRARAKTWGSLPCAPAKLIVANEKARGAKQVHRKKIRDPGERCRGARSPVPGRQASRLLGKVYPHTEAVQQAKYGFDQHQSPDCVLTQQMRVVPGWQGRHVALRLYAVCWGKEAGGEDCPQHFEG